MRGRVPVETKYRYVLNVRHWFDKVYGNTYLSYRVTDLVTGETRACPFMYGRGLEMAMAYASGERGNTSGVPVWPMTWANTVCDDVTVSRRKDMHNGGRARSGDVS